VSEVDFITQNYPGFSSEMINTLFSVCKNKIVVRDGEEIKGLAFYFKLTDETLNKVISGELSLTAIENINFCLSENGENIHFFLLVADGYKTIMTGIRRMRNENIRSVSWFSPNMKQFFIRRILCHQLS